MILTYFKIGERYGHNVSSYFSFMLLILGVNVILALIQLGNYIPYLATQRQTSISIDTIMFTSSYNGTNILIWRITNGVAICVSYVIPILYILVAKIETIWNAIVENEEQDLISRVVHDCRTKVLRYFLSYLAFSIVLVASIVLNGAISMVASYPSLIDTIVKATKINPIVIYSIASFASSIAIYVINMIWDKVNKIVSRYELHTRWSIYRNHSIFKIVLFRLLNAWMVMVMKLAFNMSCMIDQMGIQTLSITVLDLVLYNIVELILPVMGTLFYKWRGWHLNFDEFNVGEEYYEIIYRQFIMYIGMASCPLLPVIASIATIIEIVIDYVKLRWLTSAPTKENVNVYMIAMSLTMAATAAIANPVGGTLAILINRHGCT